MFKRTLYSCLLTLTLADKFNIDEKLQKLIKNRTSLKSATRSSNRNLPGNVVDQFSEYGCWCYFDGDVGRGKGQPVDEFDTLCKTLADGYQCAIIDSETVGENCIPWEVNYQTPGDLAPDATSQDRRDACYRLNNETCAGYACTVEEQFIYSLFDLLFSFVQPDFDSFKHSNGFNPSHNAGCPVKQYDTPVLPTVFDNEVGNGGGNGGSNGGWNEESEKICCGSYPVRFPFRTMNGERACCGEKTFNTQLLSCCEDGSVRPRC